MAEDTEAQTSFAWAGTGVESLTDIEDTVADIIGLDRQTLMDQWPSNNVAPRLAEAKTRLAEEMGCHSADHIFSFQYLSEIIRRDGTKIPTENTVIVLRHNNGDAPLVIGLIRACEICPFMRRIEALCRSLDEAGRCLALRLVRALAAA